MGYEGAPHGVPPMGARFIVSGSNDVQQRTANNYNTAEQLRALASQDWQFVEPQELHWHTTMRTVARHAASDLSCGPDPIPPPRPGTGAVALGNACIFCMAPRPAMNARPLSEAKGFVCENCDRRATRVRGLPQSDVKGREVESVAEPDTVELEAAPSPSSAEEAEESVVCIDDRDGDHVLKRNRLEQIRGERRLLSEFQGMEEKLEKKQEEAVKLLQAQQRMLDSIVEERAANRNFYKVAFQTQKDASESVVHLQLEVQNLKQDLQKVRQDLAQARSKSAVSPADISKVQSERAVVQAERARVQAERAGVQAERAEAQAEKAEAQIQIAKTHSEKLEMQAKCAEMSRSLAMMHQRNERLMWELEGRTVPKAEQKREDERAPALDAAVCIGTTHPAALTSSEPECRDEGAKIPEVLAHAQKRRKLAEVADFRDFATKNELKDKESGLSSNPASANQEKLDPSLKAHLDYAGTPSANGATYPPSAANSPPATTYGPPRATEKANPAYGPPSTGKASPPTAYGAPSTAKAPSLTNGADTTSRAANTVPSTSALPVVVPDRSSYGVCVHLPAADVDSGSADEKALGPRAGNPGRHVLYGAVKQRPRKRTR